jgi:hypothetical protein
MYAYYLSFCFSNDVVATHAHQSDLVRVEVKHCIFEYVLIFS